MVPENEVIYRLNWTGCPTGLTHMASWHYQRSAGTMQGLHKPSPCGLSFSQCSGLVLRGIIPRENILRDPSRNCKASLELVSKVPKHHFSHVVLVKKLKLAQTQGEKNRHLFLAWKIVCMYTKGRNWWCPPQIILTGHLFRICLFHQIIKTKITFTFSMIHTSP